MERKREICVGVLGAANAGKSTLLNTIIGQNLLPSAGLIETASICHVVHDPQCGGKYVCTTKTEVGREKTFHAAEDALNWLRTKNREEGIPEVEVKTSIRLFTDGCELNDLVGLRIVDVPGANESGNLTGKERIAKVLEECDLVLLVVKVEDIGTETVEALANIIKTNSRRACPVFVLINKMDSIEEEEKELVKASAKEKYQHSTDLFGNREIYLSFTNCKIGLASLCDPKLCGGKCKLSKTLWPFLDLYPDSSKRDWIEKLNRFRDIEEEATTTNTEGDGWMSVGLRNVGNFVLENTFGTKRTNLHRVLADEVRRLSGLDDLDCELKHQIMVAKLTKGLGLLSSDTSLSDDDLESIFPGCVELIRYGKGGKEKQLVACASLFLAQKEIDEAREWGDSDNMDIFGDSEPSSTQLRKAWAASEKLWRENLKIYFHAIQISACSDESLEKMLKHGFKELGRKLFEPKEKNWGLDVLNLNAEEMLNVKFNCYKAAWRNEESTKKFLSDRFYQANGAILITLDKAFQQMDSSLVVIKQCLKGCNEKEVKQILELWKEGLLKSVCPAVRNFIELCWRENSLKQPQITLDQIKMDLGKKDQAKLTFGGAILGASAFVGLAGLAGPLGYAFAYETLALVAGSGGLLGGGGGLLFSTDLKKEEAEHLLSILQDFGKSATGITNLHKLNDADILSWLEANNKRMKNFELEYRGKVSGK